MLPQYLGTHSPSRDPTMFRAALLAFMFAAPAFAADVTLDNLRLGEALLGKKPEKDDLKGRVVLVELWGIH
jgi:hypothetical protein